MERIASPRTDDNAIEAEIKAKGKTAPRITPADIQTEIANEIYFTAAEGSLGAVAQKLHIKGHPITIEPFDATDRKPLDLLTFCVLVLQNGFTVTGESACVSHENFDAEIGRKIARQNAEQKIWALMGYALKSELHRRAEFEAMPKVGGKQ